jgi:hypothetical protein
MIEINLLKNESIRFSSNWWFNGWTASLKFAQAITLLLSGTCDDNKFHMPTTQNSNYGCDADENNTYAMCH